MSVQKQQSGHIFAVMKHVFAVRDKNVLQIIVSLPSENLCN